MSSRYILTIDEDSIPETHRKDESSSSSDEEEPLDSRSKLTKNIGRTKQIEKLDSSFDLFKPKPSSEDAFKFSSTVEMIRESSRPSDRNRVKVGDIISRKVASLPEEDSKDSSDEEFSADESKVETITPRHPEKIPKQWRQCDTASYEVLSFDELNLSRPLLKSIKSMGFKAPTPVQSSVIPEALEGSDLLVSAVTGSGKTAAFLLPIMERLLYKPKGVHLSRVLIMCPTRELAAQCYQVTCAFAEKTKVTSVLVVGGLSEQRQAVALKQRPDIIICTPGRILDHLINTAAVHLEDVEILVLDEADRLLEMGFIDEVKEIVSLCPKSRQTMMFSATMSDQVSELADESLKNPKKIAVDPLFSLAHNLSQEFIRVRAQHDDEHTRSSILLALCTRTFKDKVIIFFPSKVLAHRMRIVFGLLKLNAAELHGNLTQVQRLEALELFKAGQVQYLLCTDLASRGLDIKGVKTVLNFSLPSQLTQYVHRVGRTARAGLQGQAVSLVGEFHHELLAEIVKRAPKQVKRRKVPSHVIEEMSSKLKSLESAIEEVLQEESIEKATRVAEMELQKSQNMIVHRDEILSRPVKQWIQKPSDEPEEAKHEEKPKSVKELEAESDLKRGQAALSIAKRLAKKEKKEIAKQQEDDSIVKGSKRYSRKVKDRDAFDARYKDIDVEEMEDYDPSLEKKKTKRKGGAFKSKKRYKRRK